MSKIKWIVTFLVVAVFMALGFWISSENSQLVQPKLMGWDLWELNLGMWLFLVFLCGGLLGFAVSWVSYLPLKSRTRSIERKLGKKEMEISHLRSSMAKD